MFETPPPQSMSVELAELEAELADPIGGVIAVELSRSFVGRCLRWAEPMVTDLARQETMLRQPGGIGLARRIFAQRFYRRADGEVFSLLRQCVPLSHAEFALSRIEDVLRDQFADVVETAASHLLSHDRDVAIQMVAVAATMAGRDVRDAVVAIISETRTVDVEDDWPGGDITAG
jgi:hypothetical protein